MAVAWLLHRVTRRGNPVLALACLPFLITATAVGQLLSGYSLAPKELTGPVQSLIATDPIWVVDYPHWSLIIVRIIVRPAT